MKQIKLVNRQLFALVDDEDYAMLSCFSWYLVESPKGCYAYTKIDDRTVYMHQLVLPSDDEKLTPDHRNGNGLDNQKSNLRLATKSQQCMNRCKQSNGITSRYKGVRYSKSGWEANIRVNNKQTYLGRFISERDAAFAYNKAATKHFGEFARLNEVE